MKDEKRCPSCVSPHPPALCVPFAPFLYPRPSFFFSTLSFFYSFYFPSFSFLSLRPSQVSPLSCLPTVSHLPLSLSPHSPASLSLGARPRHTCPRQPLLVFPTLLTTSPPALIVRYCPSFQQRYRQTLPSSADRASWGAARALTLGQHGLGSMFGSKEIGSKSSSGTVSLFGL